MLSRKTRNRSLIKILNIAGNGWIGTALFMGEGRESRYSRLSTGIEAGVSHKRCDEILSLQFDDPVTLTIYVDKLQELGVSMPPSDSSGGENSPQTHSVSNGLSGSSRSDGSGRSGGPSGSSTENIFVTGESSSITDESLATTISSNSRRSPSLNSETRSHRSSSSSSSSGSVINLASILGANERELELVG